MTRLLVLGPLTVGCIIAWLILSMLVTSATTSSVPVAHAAPYLYLSACRDALVGKRGGDNDVRNEIVAQNRAGSDVLRWGWGGALRVDSGHVAQTINLRLRNGRLVYRYYACRWGSGGQIFDWAWA